MLYKLSISPMVCFYIFYVCILALYVLLHYSLWMFEIYFLLVFSCIVAEYIWFGVFPIVIFEQSKFQNAKHIDSVYECKWMQIYTISEMLHWTFYMHTIMLSHIKLKTTSTIIVRTSWREEICGPGAYYILKDLNFIILFWPNTTELYILLQPNTISRQLCGMAWRPHIPRAGVATPCKYLYEHKLHYTLRIAA